MSAMISFPVRCQEMIGRDAELRCLVDAFRAADGGSGQTAVITGEAGIGKTRLIEAFREEVAAHGPAIYHGHCYENLADAYLPFQELLADIGYTMARSSTVRTSTPDASRASAETSHLSTREDKLRQFSIIVEGIRRNARRRSVVVIVEDAQWADAASLELFAYLAQRLGQMRVILLATMRTEPAPEMELLSFVASLHRSQVLEVHLRGLDDGEVRELIHRALRGQRLLSAELRQQIERSAEGNPFYAEEMLRSAVEEHTEGSSTRVQIPVTIRAMLRQRLVDFDSDETEILRLAAVLGRSFDATFLQSVTQLPFVRIVNALQKAQDRQIIVEPPAQPSMFAFRHALTREALYEELPRNSAAGMHGRIAAALEARPIPVAASELAYHWGAAGNEGKAMEYNERAGDESLALFASLDAIRFYRRALQFGYPAGRSRARLYENFAQALGLAGLVDEATVWLTAATTEYRQIGDYRTVAAILIDISTHLWLAAKTAESLAAIAESLVILEEAPEPLLRARASIWKARFAMTLSDKEVALESLRGVNSSELDSTLGAEYHAIRGETLAATDRVEEAAQSFEIAARLADEVGNASVLIRVQNVAAIEALDLGLTDIAIDAHRRALAIGERLAPLWQVAYLKLSAVETAFLIGDFKRAHELLISGVAHGLESSTLRTKALSAGLRVAWLVGDDELARQLADPNALEDAFQSREPQRIGGVCGALAFYYREIGQGAEAAELLHRAMGSIECLYRCWPLAEEVAAHGELEDVDNVMRMVTVRKKAGNRAAAAIWELCLAHLAVRREEGDTAVKHAESAAEAFRLLRWSYYEANACELAGRTADALGIHLRIGNLRRAHQLGTSLQRGPDSALQSKLTPRQTEIGRLVAVGDTNKEIASKLRISENTVENHLSEIFSRLGIRARSQLAVQIASSNDPG